VGQYFLLVNLDKREYVYPIYVSVGMKLIELCVNNFGALLLFLLRKSSEGGGGDINKSYKYAGRWAGDRVVLVGDYDESDLFHKALNEYNDITLAVVNEYNDFVWQDEFKLKIDWRAIRILERIGCKLHGEEAE